MSVDVAMIIQSILIIYLYWRLAKIQVMLGLFNLFMAEQIKLNKSNMDIAKVLQETKADK